MYIFEHLEMKNWINVEKKEMEGLDTKKKTSKLRRSNSMTLSLQNGMVGKISLAPFKITQNENLRKFDAIYIPNLSSSSRRSEMHFLIKKKSSLKRSRLS